MVLAAGFVWAQGAVDKRLLDGSGDEAADPRELTDEERAWIAEHPVIRVGVDPEFHPFEFMDEEGRHQGIAADYLALLGPRLGLRFEVVPGLSWSEAVERVEAREIDLLASVGRTEAREQFLTYTRPYTEFQRVIITRTDMPFLSGLADIEGLSVAVQTRSSHEGFLREESSLEPIGCPTLEECVRMVSVGEVDAFVGNVASAAHWIRRMNLLNLKVAGPASHELHTLHMAARSDWPELARILDKGLASVTAQDREAIMERWVVLHYEPKVDRRLLWSVLSVASFVILVLVLWIWSSRRQRERLEIARDEALAAEARARRANSELQELKDGLEALVEQRTEELVAAERRFQEAQKMEALGTLVGGIAHDFNNLLQGILGALFLVEDEVEDEQNKRYLREATTLGKRGADLIRQLLAVARKSAGNKSTVDLRAMLAELAPILRTSLPPTIEFRKDAPVDAMLVYGNAALLQQVVLNLVNNARDAVLGREQPRVRLSARLLAEDDVLPDGLDPGDYAVLEVEDNGPGIPDEVMQRIFEPFFTTKAKGRGTGLGLAMAFGAVQDHGGAIDVRSGTDEGTTFRVFLPLVVGTTAADEGVTDEPERGHGELILLADDEPAILAGHAEILTRLGYRTITAQDGQEALDRLAEHEDEVALVVLDVLMPVLDGAATSREIRKRWPDLPILFLSAYDPESENDLPDNLRPTGAPALMKPCTPRELCHAIRRAIERGAL
jgi:signal transduction histidine kinase